MASDNPMIGKQFGNYRLERLLGSGAFADVYLGKQEFLDSLAAVKLLKTNLEEEDVEAFRSEARTLVRLIHPHILRILDAGFQKGIPYLITEYAEGGSLRDRLKKSKGKPLPLDEAINILTQIGQALHYAHERHIIHRDLKPENILFNQAGEALLADFGIAVLLASTQTGLVGVSGTPPYMAPEQFEGLASTKSDQYSLGCIAYELVTLEVYWFHHAKVEPIPPTHHHPQLPDYIEQAILMALAKDRAYRYHDIPAFSNALLKNSNHWRDEGEKHFKASRYEEALSAYDQAIRLDPGFASAYNGKGSALHALKRFEEALSAYDQAIRLDPNNSAYNINKNAVLNEYQLLSQKQIIKLEPGDEITYVRELIEKSLGQQIVLIVPQHTQLRSNISWRLLAARSRELGKDIQVISSNQQVRASARAVGFKAQFSLTDFEASYPPTNIFDDEEPHILEFDIAEPILKADEESYIQDYEIARRIREAAKDPVQPSPIYADPFENKEDILYLDLRALRKIDGLKLIHGTANASPGRLTVLHNLLDSQIGEIQFLQLIKGLWNIVSDKRLRQEQIEALIAWAKEDSFEEEVVAVLAVLNEQ
jgi:serine/threonine protein kinase